MLPDSSHTCRLKAIADRHILLLMLLGLGAQLGCDSLQPELEKFENAQPESIAIQSFVPAALLLDRGSVTLEIANLFLDKNGDDLSYIVAVTDESVLSAIVVDASLSLVPVSLGSTSVIVTATDRSGASAEAAFTVKVINGLGISETSIDAFLEQRFTTCDEPYTIDPLDFLDYEYEDRLLFRGSVPDSNANRLHLQSDGNNAFELFVGDDTTGFAAFEIIAVDNGFDPAFEDTIRFEMMNIEAGLVVDEGVRSDWQTQVYLTGRPYELDLLDPSNTFFHVVNGREDLDLQINRARRTRNGNTQLERIESFSVITPIFGPGEAESMTRITLNAGAQNIESCASTGHLELIITENKTPTTNAAGIGRVAADVAVLGLIDGDICINLLNDDPPLFEDENMDILFLEGRLREQDEDKLNVLFGPGDGDNQVMCLQTKRPGSAELTVIAHDASTLNTGEGAATHVFAIQIEDNASEDASILPR